jgi:hypothetical protein
MNAESQNVVESVTGVMQCFDPTDNMNAESQNVSVTGMMQCFDTTNRRVKVQGESERYLVDTPYSHNQGRSN